MEPAKEDTASVRTQPGQVVSLLKDRLAEGNGRDSTKRDWSAALSLVDECFEAVRLAEQRAVSSENHANQIAHRMEEQGRMLDARIQAANKRADAAEARAREAEEWLVKFHDAIVEGFQKTFVSGS